jgi:diguanylate cyclase (GGDEF)-like protein/PAS domain S-box-containing protein
VSAQSLTLVSEPVGFGALVRRRLWVGYLVAMALVTLVYLFGPKTVNSGPVFNAIGISAVVAILVGVRTNNVKPRLPWYLFAVAQTLFVTGDVIAYNYERFFGRPLPFPSLADAFYLAFYPVLVAGILLLIRQRVPGRDSSSLIDSLIITIGAGLVSWVFLIAPYAHDRSLTLPTKLTSIAYPLMDILVLSVVVRLAFGGGRRERSITLLLLGSISLLGADAVYGWLELHGGYQTGGLLDGGWIAFYLLLGAAALHPSAASLSEAPVADAPKLTRTRLGILAAAALAAPGVQVGEHLAGVQVDVLLVAAAGCSLYVLVVARMAGLMRRQEQSEARFSSLVRNSSDVITVIGDDSTIRYASPSSERVFGYPSTELEGTPLSGLVHPEDGDRLLDLFSSMAGLSGVHAPVELRIRERNGTWLDVETLATNLLDDPTVEGIVLNTRDVSERKAFERQLERHAYYDQVTGLANRALFRDRVAHALDRIQRQPGNVVVMFMDIDDFKVVNDTFGHAAGDALLRAVGERVRPCLRVSDTIARLGGDEFAILLEDGDDSSRSTEVAERILAALEQPFWIEENHVDVHASLGVASVNGGPHTKANDDLMRDADVAMYMAKAQGKSRFAVYQPTMTTTVLARLELKDDLRRALTTDDQLVLHYQPIVALANGRVTGYEALARWRHPERGLIGPGSFIPMAEETGLIVPMGGWALEEACRQARRLQERFPRPLPLGMSVNLSARQLQWSGLVGEIKQVLEATRIDPHALTIEVTESTMIDDVELAVRRLAELRALGLRIAIDDFGAGYSSLNYIRRLPVDILKIDKSFVDHIDRGEEQVALAAAIIDVARVLSLITVAEGVERSSQLKQLLELGCDRAQGYYFAKPASSATIERLLASESPTLA